MNLVSLYSSAKLENAYMSVGNLSRSDTLTKSIVQNLRNGLAHSSRVHMKLHNTIAKSICELY